MASLFISRFHTTFSLIITIVVGEFRSEFVSSGGYSNSGYPVRPGLVKSFNREMGSELTEQSEKLDQAAVDGYGGDRNFMGQAYDGARELPSGVGTDFKSASRAVSRGYSSTYHGFANARDKTYSGIDRADNAAYHQASEVQGVINYGGAAAGHEVGREAGIFKDEVSEEAGIYGDVISKEAKSGYNGASEVQDDINGAGADVGREVGKDAGLVGVEIKDEAVSGYEGASSVLGSIDDGVVSGAQATYNGASYVAEGISEGGKAGLDGVGLMAGKAWGGFSETAEELAVPNFGGGGRWAFDW